MVLVIRRARWRCSKDYRGWASFCDKSWGRPGKQVEAFRHISCPILSIIRLTLLMIFFGKTFKSTYMLINCEHHFATRVGGNPESKLKLSDTSHVQPCRRRFYHCCYFDDELTIHYADSFLMRIPRAISQPEFKIDHTEWPKAAFATELGETRKAG